MNPALNTGTLRSGIKYSWTWLFYLAALLAIYLARNNPFFWDTVQLASKQAHFFYENGFGSIILPPEIDSGHPPFFGAYIALAWKIFGKTLVVSHFAMLPFVWGIVFLLLKTGKQISGQNSAYGLVLLYLADPVFASQSILVSPDVALFFFFLLAYYSISEEKSAWLLSIAIVGLALISMRGMMLAAGLFLFSLFTDNNKLSLGSFLSKILPFLPAGLIALWFFYLHFASTGWIAYHPDSTWAPSFEKVDGAGILKNITVLGWRMLDFGRVFVWAMLGLVLLLKWSERNSWCEFSKWRHSKSGQLIALLLFTSIALIPAQLLYKGLLAHRYLMPVYFSLTLLLFHHIQSGGFSFRARNSLYGIAFFGLLSGNFWIYPVQISMGWDSTLAHTPWYGLQKDMNEFIANSRLSYDQIGTAFPNIGPRENIELNNELAGFVEKDLNSHCYILWSNVMNDFSDSEIDQLEKKWLPLKRLEKGGVCLILYQNQNPALCAN